MRAPWLIEMHVRIDHAGKHMESLGVDLLFARACEGWLDGDDATIGNGEVSVTDTRRGNQRAVTRQEPAKTHCAWHGTMPLQHLPVGRNVPCCADLAGPFF